MKRLGGLLEASGALLGGLGAQTLDFSVPGGTPTKTTQETLPLLQGVGFEGLELRIDGFALVLASLRESSFPCPAISLRLRGWKP